MPSLEVLPKMPEEKPKKDKKMKNKEFVQSMEIDDKKLKRTKMISNQNSESESEVVINQKKESKKKDKKKRKVSEIDKDENKSDTSSEMGEPVNTKKAKVDEDKKPEDPNAVSKFWISKPLVEALKAKGIEALFPIQAMTFDTILDGFGLIGRARTGQGKTLAFVLPILESLFNGPAKSERKTGYGKALSVIILLPTRELAKQEMKLKRSVDLVIGTSGRIKDHLERGNIDLPSLKFQVLDKADEMLRMGFVDDVELILGKVEDVTKVQTLLFSATLPDWVKKIEPRFFKANKKSVDLIAMKRCRPATMSGTL